MNDQCVADSRLLDVRDIRFSYGRGPEVLKGVSLSMDPGDILCLLGSNGTGKTTLLRCLLGFMKQTQGSAHVDGNCIAKLRPADRAHYIAYVPQSSNLAFPYLAKEVVLMGRVSHLRGGAAPSKADKDAAMLAMEHLKISHLADRRYQELSGGERQMVLVARALAQEAKLLVMDEPTSNLDYHNQVKILAAIKHLAAEGLGILMTSHYPDHAFLACSKVALMAEGCIVSIGHPDDIVTSASLTELYHTPVHVGYTEVDGQRLKTCIPLLDNSSFRKIAEQDQADATTA